jgi:hypothetical protein
VNFQEEVHNTHQFLISLYLSLLRRSRQYLMRVCVTCRRRESLLYYNRKVVEKSFGCVFWCLGKVFIDGRRCRLIDGSGNQFVKATSYTPSLTLLGSLLEKRRDLAYLSRERRGFFIMLHYRG